MWARNNPYIFPGPGPWNYSRFKPGELGTNEQNDPTERGTVSTPEAQFQIPPGQVIPTAWASNTGNLLGPGATGKTNAAPTIAPGGPQSESAYAANS